MQASTHAQHNLLQSDTLADFSHIFNTQFLSFFFFFFFFDYPNRKISNGISKLIVGAVCWNSNIWSRNGIGDWFV